jgi:hypothetical protein
MPFNRLILAVVLLNFGVLGYHLGHAEWQIDDGSALSAASSLTLVNFVAAVLIRQQNVLNVLFGLAGRGSRSWPLWLRWSVSKVHHVGGIHVGSALAGTVWLCAFTYMATTAHAHHPASVSATTLVLAYCLVALVVLVVVCAAPPVRSRAHNVFELSHRFAGWTSIALFWALTVHLALRGRGDTAAVEAIASDWHVWVVALLTASIASPWLRLRRVPVTVERPSSHAAIVPLRLRSHACVRVGRRHQPQSAARMARFRHGHNPERVRIPPARLPRRRLDRALHRRPPVPPLGPGHAGLRADGEGRASIQARRLRRHGQRHRPVPRADPGRARPREARLVDAQPEGHLRRRPRRRG